MNGERNLEDRHAIVTGGGRGIGAAIAAALAREGARLTIMGRSMEALDETAAGLRRNEVDVFALRCDVADGESVSEAFAEAVERQGVPHVLVNNAGIAISRKLVDLPRDIWDETIAVNLTGVYLCTSAVLPAMIEAKAGRIISISSTAGLRGYKTMTAYAASKHGVIGFTKSLALEVAKLGITVNAVCPAYTNTAMADRAVEAISTNLGKTEDEALRMLTGNSPRGTLIEAVEVASAVAWLASPAAAGVTGIALPVAAGEV